MNYRELRERIAETRERARALGRQLAPVHETENALVNSASRRWKVDHRFFVSFRVSTIDDDSLCFFSPLGMEFTDEHHSSHPRITKDGLRRAMEIATHIEEWMAGTIPELKPSGAWDANVPTEES